MVVFWIIIQHERFVMMRPQSSRSFRTIILVVCLAASVGNSGCATYNVYQVGGPGDIEAGNQPSTEWEGKTLHSVFWGAIRQDLPVEGCALGDGTRTGIEEVRIESSVLYTAVSILTLGLWQPLKVSYRCAKAAGPTGEL
jgi:hypothetical protein